MNGLATLFSFVFLGTGLFGTHLPDTAPSAPVVRVAAENGTAGTVEMGIGLAPIADWGTQQPFIDVMKALSLIHI